MMGAAQKVAIITGASQGIGEALVKGYRNRNYRVVASSRSIKPSSDPDVLTVADDVADPKTAECIVSQALERFSRIDTLVNNAGIFIAKPFTDYTDEDYASILSTNLNGFFRVTRRAAREMEKQGSGRADHDQPCRSGQQQRAVGAGIADQGWIERGDQVARDRVRKEGASA
jgi:NAD(P)-dependent dehydrogenase (short-subunit alcohol dehydrogenase family)